MLILAIFILTFLAFCAIIEVSVISIEFRGYKNMMDSMSWGENPKYGPQAMVAHFDRDDTVCLDFQDYARQIGKKVMVKQCAGRDGLTIIIPDISFKDMNHLINHTESF